MLVKELYCYIVFVAGSKLQFPEDSAAGVHGFQGLSLHVLQFDVYTKVTLTSSLSRPPGWI